MQSASSGPLAERVFVVHGNAVARDAMFEFLGSIGLRPIEWSEAIRSTGKGSPYIGEVLDAAFAEAQAIVILMTPDEIAYLRAEYAGSADDPETEPTAQARPNVLFEAGIAMGRDSDRAILVELGSLRPFSDIAGRHAVRLDGSELMRRELARRLETAGCPVDLTGEAWLQAGDFTRPPPPGGGLPLGERAPRGESQGSIRLDLRYHDRGKKSRLEIVNLGNEPVFDVDLEFPPEAEGFIVITDELPVAKLPPTKSVMLPAFKTWGGGKDHFDVTITARTADGDDVVHEAFLSVAG